VHALSEAALGLANIAAQNGDAAPPNGFAKEQPPAVEEAPSPVGRPGASSGSDKLPIRPQAVSLRSSSGAPSSGGKQLHSGRGLRGSKQALAAALDWEHGSLSNKNCEGSATSDEDHPRCSRLSYCVRTVLGVLVVACAA
jgi:hypothetical protein